MIFKTPRVDLYTKETELLRAMKLSFPEQNLGYLHKYITVYLDTHEQVSIYQRIPAQRSSTA